MLQKQELMSEQQDHDHDDDRTVGQRIVRIVSAARLLVPLVALGLGLLLTILVVLFELQRRYRGPTAETG